MPPLNLGTPIISANAIPIRTEGGALVAGDLVYVSSWSETYTRMLVSKADADAAGKRAVFVMRDALANTSNGLAYTTYRSAATQNTVGATVGDPVYLDTTAGGWTLTAPPGAAATKQIIGRVAIVSATVGVVEFDIRSNNGLVAIGSNELQTDSVTAAAIVAGGVANAELGALAVTATKIKFFKSAEQTGNGSSQNVAHGLGSTPGLVFILASDAGSTFTFAEGSHDATNVVVTVANAKKYIVIAIA